MKTFKIAVALVAVFLATVGTTWGDYCAYDFERTPGFYSPYLDSYLITLRSDVTAFRNINIFSGLWYVPSASLATVHQVNDFGGPLSSRPMKTLWLGEMASESEPYDTHFMFAYDAGQVIIGEGASETNTKYTSPERIRDSYGFYYGLGTLSSDTTDGFILREVLPAGTPFMQVVVPRGSGSFCITGTAVVNGRDTGLLFLFPEPGTVAMLFAGAICLLAVRLRKRARHDATA